MNEPSKIIPIAPAVDDTSTAIPRRAALQALLGGIGATLALPSEVSAQHPIHTHLANPAAIAQAQRNASAATSAREFFDEHQAKTVEALAETIVPGSTAARVAPFLDQLLAVDSAATQQAFIGSLGAFDMAAVTKHNKAWISITAAEQDAILREASTADAKTSALRAHFENLKQWIAGAYYSSEPGMRELGWTGNVVHAELPGCTHPGGHQD